ncbi:hypothetical protein SUGI_0728440 [Cryptomeria japonica]|nr:hypothetical protein SUGI_0728440 [Cryptomeria japonica]
MAEDHYTSNFHEPVNTNSNLLDAVTYNSRPLKRQSDGNLIEKNTQQLILQSQEEIKRSRRNQSIIFSEKMRRIKMRQLFSTLQSLLPVSTTDKIINQVERCSIIEETGKYIQSLQNKTQGLQKKKAHLLATRGSLIDHNSSATDRESIRLDVCVEVYSGETVIIRTSASRMPLSLYKIFEVVERDALEIQSSDVYKGDSIVFLYIHATVIVSIDGHNSLQMTQIEPRLSAALQNVY